MVELGQDDFELMRERFERLLKIPGTNRSEENIFELMRLTGKFKIFETFKMSAMHKEICRHIFIRTLERGEVIFKQGDDGDAYYFMLRGCVDLYMYDVDQIDGKTKLKFLASILPGNGFGELALLYDCPRASTAIPNAKTDLVVFKKKLYMSFVKDLHEKDLLELVRFYYSIPIFKKEPINNILKYCLRTNRKFLNAYEPFIRYGDYIGEYSFVKNGIIKAYVKIKFNKTLLKNASKMDEETFVGQLKELQLQVLPKHDRSISKKKSTAINSSIKIETNVKFEPIINSTQPTSYDATYEEVIDIMEFNNGEMYCEYYAAKYKRVDIYLLPTLPTEIISIRSDDLKKINPLMYEAIGKFAGPIFEPERVFKKLYKTLVWKKTKTTLLYNVINKKD